MWPVASSWASWPIPAAGDSASGDPELVITFDDGPNPGTTGKVLDILGEHRVSAVFFVVSKRIRPGDRGAADLIDRMIREGHIVANHTETHAQLCSVSKERAAAEIDDAERRIATAAAMPIRWFRAPYGARCRRLETLLDERSLRHFHWDVDPQEWKHRSGTAAATYVIRRLKRLRGRAVVLFHDTKPATVAALPVILRWVHDENGRRTQRGQRPIRIVGAAGLAAEQAAPALSVVGLAASAAHEWSAALRLVLP